MASVNSLRRGEFSKTSSRVLLIAALLGVGLSSPAFAKGPSLNAIELYDAPSGPAYVQLADVLISGKLELRSCASLEANPIDKSTYNKLPKLVISAGAAFERVSAGILRYHPSDGPATCVLPDGVKFEHNATFTAASMANGRSQRSHCR